MNRKTIFLAVLLTVFSLGMVGGVVKAVTSRQPPQVQVQTEPAALTTFPTTQTQLLNTTAQEIQTGINADSAAQIGLAAAGAGELLNGMPSLVDFNGVVAYQVALVDGNTVFVNAQDGTLLYNSITGTASAVITQMQAVQIAGDYLHYYQALSVEMATVDNKLQYLVKFLNGANVYVDLGGQVVAVEYVQYAQANNTNQVQSPVSSQHEQEDSQSESDDD